MSTLSEQVDDLPVGATAIHDALAAGVDVLSGQQTVGFVPYVRTVLPVDGFVFWLNASLLTPAQRAQHGLESADSVFVENASLHYASVGHMVEDESIAIRRVDLTSQTQITAFAEIAPDVLYVGSWSTPLGTFRFTFSQRSTFYQQASLFHYVGDAVYPTFVAQLIDSNDQFDRRQVVSNSLPIWLSMLRRVPYVTLTAISLPLYPAFLVPINLVPPYGAVDIPPSSTRAIASAAWLGRDASRWQLTYERVRLSLYGLRNEQVMDLLDYVIEWAANTGNIGISNSPVVQDDHRQQVELTALAQKKTIEFEVNYNQQRCREIARMLISDVLLTPIPGDNPILPTPGEAVPLIVPG